MCPHHCTILTVRYYTYLSSLYTFQANKLYNLTSFSPHKEKSNKLANLYIQISNSLLCRKCYKKKYK